jgi:DNA-binding NarL/FixJ family response regulator
MGLCDDYLRGAGAECARTRTELSEAVHRRERARSKLRRLQPEEALSEWCALVAGRWSLLDEVEADGRRFIIARRNPVPAPPLATLTPEQAQVVGFALLGHSNKLIAYELGLTESGVAMRLSRAAHKLGARSRVAMIRTVRRLLEQVP